MTLALWALPGVITLGGLIAVVVVTSRLTAEAALLKLELARVADLRSSARVLAAEARALRSDRHG